MAIPNELNKDINAIVEPSNRVLIRSLVFAVIALFGGLMFLYKVGIGDKKSAIAKAEVAAEKVAKEAKAEVEYWKAAYRLKDSLYNDCGEKRLEDANETRESIRRRLENTSEIKKLVKKSK